MGMPKNLLLIRHGESEGNVAIAHSRAGDNRDYVGGFKKRHSSKWRLSALGEEQARKTGAWIQESGLQFDRYYVSEYLRAMETAALLGIEDARWYPEIYLRERTWGDLDRVSVQEREEKFQKVMKERKIDPFFWIPPGGESIADVCFRIDRIIHTLHRECNGKNVIIVCHGEVMWAFRVRLERMSQERFFELEHSSDPVDRIHNCQILHYTRKDPFNNDPQVAPYLNWVRSFCPCRDKEGQWQKIIRTSYTNEALLKRVRQFPVLVK